MPMRYCERCNVRCLTTLCGQCEQQDQIDKASSEAVEAALATERARIAAAIRLARDEWQHGADTWGLWSRLLRVVEDK